MTNPFQQLLDIFAGMDAQKSGFANVPAGYPKREEINFARASQFGPPQDTPFNQGDLARVSQGSPLALVQKGIPHERTELQKPSPANADAMTATSLLANRAPIAGLGWDPRQVVLNQSGRELNASGAYNPKSDMMYVDEAQQAGTGVHEAVHRGIMMLKRGGSKLAASITPQQEEAISRYTEQVLLGKMERTGFGKTQGMDIWSKDPNFIKRLTALNQEAAAMVAKTRPGGAR